MIRALCLALGWAMLLSVIVSLFLPRFGIHQPGEEWIAPRLAGHWRGIYTHKNTLGNTASFALLMFAIFSRYVIKSAILKRAALVAVGACLIGAASGTGVIVAMIMIAVSIGFSLLLDVRRGTRVFVLGSASFLIGLAFISAIPVLSVVFEILGKDPDLTGRVPIWSTLMPWALERPWLGYGFSSFEQAMLPRYYALTGEKLVNAHSGYLETFISFGYLGLAILAAVLISFTCNVVHLLRRHSPYERLILPFAVSVFVGVLCSNITESFFLAYASIHGVIFAIAYILVAVSRSMATVRVSQRARNLGTLELRVSPQIPIRGNK
jgi:O-antigen ligase